MPRSYYIMETYFKETIKYIKIYIPTGNIGNRKNGHEMKKIIFNKYEKEIYKSLSFIRKEEVKKFKSNNVELNLNLGTFNESYPILAKILLTSNI